ncbi:MAG: hypothetical protein QG608_1881 [Actinomycetota bacterium]|nr:hypothetical protein [Actinomycetota bacterium]
MSLIMWEGRRSRNSLPPYDVNNALVVLCAATHGWAPAGGGVGTGVDGDGDGVA